MILKGRNVELVPFFGWDDWKYCFDLAIKHDKRLTEEMLVSEALTDGFQFYVGYVNGVKSGVVFSKHYRGGLTLDAYSDVSCRSLDSLEAAHLMLSHLLKFTPVVYVRIDKGNNKLHRLCKAIGLKYDHSEESRTVYSKRREEYQTFDWDTSGNKDKLQHYEATRP